VVYIIHCRPQYPNMECAKNTRADNLKKFRQMVKDNNAINDIVGKNGELVRTMAYDDLTKLECTRCVNDDTNACRHYRVNSDERCKAVVEQYYVAQKEMIRETIIKN
jgi:hypothetical protein